MAIVLSVALILTVVSAMFSKSVSSSLIMLFYSSLILGVVFAVYGSILVGVVHIITFAGAVSVMLLTVILMTGKSDLSLHSGRTVILVFSAIIATAIVASYFFFSGSIFGLGQFSGGAVQDLLGFIWTYRPWDMLILIMVFASSLIAITNVLSKEET